MPQKRGVHITGVSAGEYAALCAHLREHHELSMRDAGGKLEVEGGGLLGTLDYDEETGSVKVYIHQHPAVVTPGYLIGFLFDQLGAAKSARQTAA